MLDKLIQTIVPEPCFTKIFTDYDFFDVPCLKIIISKCLGYGIILGSVLVKLPQIIKMMSARSGEGISFLSVLFELIAVSANVAYSFNHNFPFSSYGEGLFLALQTSLVLFLVLFYHGQVFQSFLFVVVYGSAMAYLLSPMAPVPLITTAQTLNIFIVIASKLLQVFANFKNGSTGQLSAITQVLLFLGSVARIFTTLQETGDQLTVLMYIISSTCNGLLVVQLIYYWNAADHKKKGKKKHSE